MSLELTQIEARILGCLLEKSVVTPDQYPLTLNSLTNACNQKSAREPVMNLEQGEVQRGLRQLQDKRLVVADENFKTRAEKFTHRFCNTPFSDYQFEAPEYAIVCVLLLRGPRTPGELRANAGRLHTFPDNQAVLIALQNLQADSVVRELPRTPGRRDSEYVHCFFGQDAVAEQIEQRNDTRQTSSTPTLPSNPSSRSAGEVEGVDLVALQQRVTQLEREVAQLRVLLDR